MDKNNMDNNNMNIKNIDIKNIDKNKNPQPKGSNITIGISQGDFNGIGYEVLLNCFSDPRVLENFTPILYGSSKILSYYKKMVDLPNFSFTNIKHADQAEKGKLNILNIVQEEVKIDVGQATEIAGELAALSLNMASEDLMKGKFDALVTNPINKKNIQSPNFHFPGHTEFLTKKFGIKDSLMIMACDKIKIGILTNHLALKDVPSVVTEDLVLRKLRIFDQSLKRDFAIRMPKIAVLALNPHAGDHGVNGDEDEQIIMPAIKKAFNENILAFGPFPSDGFFGMGEFKNYDGVLALYHDQGLIPFKLMSFYSGVNFTAGLPFVRTSPAHGTAYHIAGKNLANPDSFRNAVFMAMDICKNRMEYDELTSNVLQISKKDHIVDEDITNELQKDDEPTL
ncbi:MAG: 4-hydroxythreonine-4-phosphate dehydrogenase PdxA [Bacteroidales bacterium]|jgi:4-hydroxythreonine-4-phosphate dehydrogenase|nr:4-hydroxythreonine-4-phosphate dehydrogenase PdxA [Bacteroidales bacterium]MDY4789364.1 4-hydroxythreonine-4-phosphate dehydrogenase PdxA [Bacteroidales bacterium]